jgi:hypothetical protein
MLIVFFHSLAIIPVLGKEEEGKQRLQIDRLTVEL